MKIQRIKIDFNALMIEILYDDHKTYSYSIPYHPVYELVISLLRACDIKARED